MRSQGKEGSYLVRREQSLGHSAAAPLALLRQSRGALLQARHHLARHANWSNAAATCDASLRLVIKKFITDLTNSMLLII